MRFLVAPLLDSTNPLARGVASIAVGLVILSAAMLWPGVPAVTAMALVAFGATSLMIARYRERPAFIPALFAHVAIYGSLYTVFVGATLHAAASRSGAGLSGVSMADLAFSIVPLAFAFEQVRCEQRIRHLN